MTLLLAGNGAAGDPTSILQTLGVDYLEDKTTPVLHSVWRTSAGNSNNRVLRYLVEVHISSQSRDWTVCLRQRPFASSQFLLV